MTGTPTPENLDPSSLREILRSNAFGDPITIGLLKKLEGAKSPIWADELPLAGVSEYIQLVRLDQLEGLKIAESELKDKDHTNVAVREYRMTPFGKSFVRILMAEK